MSPVLARLPGLRTAPTPDDLDALIARSLVATWPTPDADVGRCDCGAALTTDDTVCAYCRAEAGL